MENRSNRKNKLPGKRSVRDSLIKSGNDSISLVIVGSIGLDDIKTPVGKVENAMGGSAIHSSLAASFFTNPSIIGIIGQDFPKKYLDKLVSKKIDLNGLARGNINFRWSGYYENDMNEAHSLKTGLNALADYKPVLKDQYCKAKFLFLAACPPSQQLSILNQAAEKPFVLLDTRDGYIRDNKDELVKVIKRSSLFILNEYEARLFCNHSNLIVAGREILSYGPKYVIIKKGEHGSLLFSKNGFFSAPSYPLENLTDPTGCGDSFAGGLIGYLAKTGDTSEKNVRKGIIYGSAIAAYCAEDFATRKLEKLNLEDIKKRYKELEKMREF